MRVLCLLLHKDFERRPSLAEACLAFSPQVAVGTDAVFVEIGASQKIFSEADCIQRLQEVLQVLDLKASMGLASQLPTALACARHGRRNMEELPIEALADYLQPFAPTPFKEAEVFRKLGVLTIGDFKKIPRRELPARFGKTGPLAYERLLEAGKIAWPRFQPAERIKERADLDFAAQITTFEPVLFLLKSLFHRVFLRLYARRLKLAGFTVCFHLNRFASASARERVSEIALPLPQSEPKSVLGLTAERLMKELELRPLSEALEGVSVEVLHTAPFHDTQRDFFSKAEAEHEAWAALVGRLQERLGKKAAFLAAPAPRLLPEASWVKTLDERERGTLVEAPLRPLRLLPEPLRLQRKGDLLEASRRRWRILSFSGPERLRSEWWLGLTGFEREYFRVETEGGETLWVFSAPCATLLKRGLWLHGVYD